MLSAAFTALQPLTKPAQQQHHVLQEAAPINRHFPCRKAQDMDYLRLGDSASAAAPAQDGTLPAHCRGVGQEAGDQGRDNAQEVSAALLSRYNYIRTAIMLMCVLLCTPTGEC